MWVLPWGEGCCWLQTFAKYGRYTRRYLSRSSTLFSVIVTTPHTRILFSYCWSFHNMIHHKTTTMTNCKSTRNWHSIRVCCSIVASISTTLILCGRGCSTGNNFLFRTTTNQSSKTMMLGHSSFRGRKVDSIEQMKEFVSISLYEDSVRDAFSHAHSSWFILHFI